MMLLLDTHVFLWYITADSKLPVPLRVAIQDTANEVFLSAVSVWEAVIKHGMGKLPLPGAPAEFLPQQRAAHGISALPVDEGAMMHLAALAPLHRDPFDRLLVAQAIQHGLTIATIDPEIAAYSVGVLPTA
jgi:PIN domain nuclease of toxin-antitoxin system